MSVTIHRANCTKRAAELTNGHISSIRLAKSYLRQYDDKAESIWRNNKK